MGYLKDYDVTTESLRPVVTIEMVEKFRNSVFEGEILNAEIYLGKQYMEFVVDKVQVIKKYPHIALTNKGVYSWNNLATHNPNLVDIQYA